MTYKEISDEIEKIEKNPESLERLMSGTATEVICYEVCQKPNHKNYEL